MNDSEQEATTHRPNPGSNEAINQGCRCAVLDNNHGKFPPFPATKDDPEGWWISVNCPLHLGDQIDAQDVLREMRGG